MIDSTYATIVSQLPYPLIESKPGLHPNEFTIEAAAKNGFSLTIIPNNVHYLVNPDMLAEGKEVRHIKVPVPAIELAQSIIYDYVSALLGASPPDTVPGIFAVSGNYTDKKEVAITFMKDIEAYRRFQNNWFANLVMIADDIWSKNQSPAGISDLQRDACRALDFKRDWLSSAPNELIPKCPFCQNSIILGAIKCLSCGEILDRKKYAELVGAK